MARHESPKEETVGRRVVKGKDGRTVGVFGSTGDPKVKRLAEEFDRIDEESNEHTVDTSSWLE